MNAALTVRHTKTFDGRALALVDGLPGGGAELTPHQMRAIANALQLAANDCEQSHAKRSLRTTVWTYALMQEGAAA